MRISVTNWTRAALALFLLGGVLTGCAGQVVVPTPTLEPSPTQPAPTDPPPTATEPLPTVTVSPTNTARPPTATPIPVTGLTGEYPPQPEGVPFPAEDWPVGDWPDGVDRAAVDAAVDTAFAGGGSLRVRAVLIVHGGELIYERYSPNGGDTPTTLMPGYSMAKSLTSALVGILVRDRRLSVDDPAPVTEWTAGDPRVEITIDNLLRMESGLEFDQGRPPEYGDQGAMVASGDAAYYAAEMPLVIPPGSAFHYSSGNTVILDRILADQVGYGEDFLDFVRAELFDKLGITRFDLQFDRTGTWLGSHAANLTARDWARFGLLYLRDGVWDGERILPEGWVDYSRTPAKTNPEYGAGWWLDLLRPHVFYAVGVNGQAITVDLEHDLVIVTLATDSRTSLLLSELFLDSVFDKSLLP